MACRWLCFLIRLSWIVSQEPLQLLLVPGLQSASITAAAAGDKDALLYLRFVAQYSAAHRSMLNPSELDTCCLLASELHPEDSDGEELDIENELSESCPALREAFFIRQRFTAELLTKAVREGQLAALQWIRELCHQIYGDDEGLMDLAAGRGSIDMMAFLRSGPRPAPWDVEVIKSAVSHPSCLQWLLSQPGLCPCNHETVEHAASQGSLEALKVLHAAKLPGTMWRTGVCSSAAAHPNSLPMLTWLRAQQPPVPWDEGTCACAALEGNLSLLQWLRAQEPPAPWDVTCTAAAARRGNLSLLRWLRAQRPRCPWDRTCAAAAAAAGSVSILQWLRAQVPPCPWELSTCAEQAARHGTLVVLQWLTAQHAPCPLSAACLEGAATRGDLPILQWLSSQGCPLSGTLYILAANRKCGNLVVLKWLHSQGAPAPSRAASRQLRTHVASPTLLFLGDVGADLSCQGIYELGQFGVNGRRLRLARRTLCTFQGLLRWCRRAVSDPSKGIHRAFDSLSANASGQSLLVRLSMLPQELIDRIAVAAELQHDLLK